MFTLFSSVTAKDVQRYTVSLFFFFLLLLLSVSAFTHRVWAQQDGQVAQTHAVVAGETLSTIAEFYGVTLEELMAENGITDPDAIDIGQLLLLPATAERQPTPLPLPTHVVQAGETLSEVAEAYNVSLTRLMLFNGLRDANELFVGQELRIPPAEAEAVTTVATPNPTATRKPTPKPTSLISTTEKSHTAMATAMATATASTATPRAHPVPPQPTAQRAGSASADAAGARLPPVALDPEVVAAQIASLNRTYTVSEGDTFPRIALRAGVNQEALRQLNGLDAEDLGNLLIGQPLLLPATGEDLRVSRPGKEYVIQPGDSLGSIANQFDLELADLLTANYIADPNTISIGQRLTIPPPTASEADVAQTNRTVGPARSGFYYYTVQRGDTLSELAQAFNSTKLALLEYNGLPDEQTVYAGLELRIPYGPPALPDRRPPVPASGTSFLVSLSRQQCWLFQGTTVAKAWTCSTGYGDWITRVGTFAVQSKIEVAESSAYRLDMPYWLGIYNVGQYENGIHGLPVAWDTGEKLWAGLIGEPATFGCAMLNDTDAAELFATAYIGMPIHVIH